VITIFKRCYAFKCYAEPVNVRKSSGVIDEFDILKLPVLIVLTVKEIYAL
jgi:hypothetical protein